MGNMIYGPRVRLSADHELREYVGSDEYRQGKEKTVCSPYQLSDAGQRELLRELRGAWPHMEFSLRDDPHYIYGYFPQVRVKPRQ